MTAFNLLPGYSARPISSEVYRDACQRLEGQIFGGNWLYDFGPPVKAPPPLGETFTYGIYSGEELIGWSHSQQLDERTVYMADTGILPEHQGRGLYKRLLPRLLDVFKQAGYTLVQSHHRATNNRVIIPKLRAGFYLQGLNLYEGGLNCALTCSLDDAYRGAQHVRSGFLQAQGETARRLGVEALPKTAKDIPHVLLPAAEGEDIDLGDGYALRPVSTAAAWDVADALESLAFDSVSFDWQKEMIVPAAQFQRWAWIVRHGDEIAGWQVSRQWDRRTAYMINTALLPPHRGKGVYSRLLPVILAHLAAQGYDLVRSHHLATNNAVIVPKLRAGFRLQGLEVDHHGVVAVLIHSFNDLYREYMDVRSGLTRPQGEVARRLGLGLPPEQP